MSLRAGEFLHVGQIVMSNLRRARAIRLSASRGNRVRFCAFLVIYAPHDKGQARR
jgi:hypothetical protein